MRGLKIPHALAETASDGGERHAASAVSIVGGMYASTPRRLVHAAQRQRFLTVPHRRRNFAADWSPPAAAGARRLRAYQFRSRWWRAVWTRPVLRGRIRAAPRPDQSLPPRTVPSRGGSPEKRRANRRARRNVTHGYNPSEGGFVGSSRDALHATTHAGRGRSATPGRSARRPSRSPRHLPRSLAGRSQLREGVPGSSPRRPARLHGVGGRQPRALPKALGTPYTPRGALGDCRGLPSPYP